MLFLRFHFKIPSNNVKNNRRDIPNCFVDLLFMLCLRVRACYPTAALDEVDRILDTCPVRKWFVLEKKSKIYNCQTPKKRKRFKSIKRKKII